MLNISVQRLERTTSFFFVDNLIGKETTDIEIFVYPFNSKAHRDGLMEVERMKEADGEITDAQRLAVVAAYLIHSHAGLLDGNKDLDVSDKTELAKKLEGEFDLINQVLAHAKKKSNWATLKA